MAKNVAHDAALAALIPAEERAEYEHRVRALIARNAMLEVIESARAAAELSKKDLAAAAGLEASSVRRLLTAQTANPTVENAFRLLDAVGVKVEAVLPTGKRVSLLTGKTVTASAATRTARKTTSVKTRAPKRQTLRARATAKNAKAVSVRAKKVPAGRPSAARSQSAKRAA